MFVFDMNAPGVTVRPLRQMTGGANFNEVFFDDVRIPADRILGEPGDGWRCAITVLMNERVSVVGEQRGEDVPARSYLDASEDRSLEGSHLRPGRATGPDGPRRPVLGG